MTLIELLLVIAIVAMLLGLLLPAVQTAREAARRVSCSSNVRQLVAAGLGHEQAQGFFPSGGWGWWWVGDADLGFGWRQPGGWMYSSLPYLEQLSLYNLAGDGDPAVISEAQRLGAVQTVRTPLPVINCPSRRPPRRYPKPTDGTFIAWNAGRNPEGDNAVARSCYAANGGHTNVSTLIDWWGPLASVDLTNPRAETAGLTRWPDQRPGAGAQLSGLSFSCSEVQAAVIRDGLSQTYLLGERYIDANHYDTGMTGSDNETWASGTNNDTIRTGGWQPRQDVAGWDNGAALLFGGPHAVSFCMGFADGSVQWIAYTIEPAVHASMAHRDDGQRHAGAALP